ncbi:hypothetical protein AAA799D07_00150 [Marine Group I thaumarchaeote SCGC AAA799-D07]|jgi:hypothetical protein|nr:hypothetical protein AAA799D07_00150 [Marine Group I thaumarchaeote SCGC AAA799-D07]
MGKKLCISLSGFSSTSHVYALLDGNRNYKDVLYDHLGNQYIRNVYDFHN